MFQTVGLAVNFCLGAPVCVFGHRLLSEKKCSFVRHEKVQHSCKPSHDSLVKTKKDLHAMKKLQVVEVSTDQVNLARPEKLNNSSCGTEVRYICLQ